MVDFVGKERSIRRQEFIALVSSAAADWPLALRAALGRPEPWFRRVGIPAGRKCHNTRIDSRSRSLSCSVLLRRQALLHCRRDVQNLLGSSEPLEAIIIQVRDW